MHRREVVAQRFARQRLTSEPFASPAETVSALLAMQAQDPALSRLAIGQRTGLDDERVRAAFDRGEVVRTHVLRPTWHTVAAADLGWLLALTSPRVERSMAARHRQLEITTTLVDTAFTALDEALAGGARLTRPELGRRLAELADLPESGEQLGHLLLLAELRGVICGGGWKGPHHTYALAADWLPPTAPFDPDEATRELTRRFFVGHGPATADDLARWAKLTKTTVRNALDDLGDELASDSVELDGPAGPTRHTVWLSAAPPPAVRPDAPPARLLHTFDEAYLTYPRINLDAPYNEPRWDNPRQFAEMGGGIVVGTTGDGEPIDVGWWRRTVDSHAIALRVRLDAGLPESQLPAIAAAADELGSFARLPVRLDLETVDGPSPQTPAPHDGREPDTRSRPPSSGH